MSKSWKKLKSHWGEIRETFKYGMVLGNKWVQNYVATHRWAQTVGGVIAGSIGGPIGAAYWSAYTADVQGGSFSQVVGAGLTSYVTAGITNSIGDAYVHESSYLTIGNTYNGVTVTVEMATKKAIMHGIVRGMVQAGQGGKFESGFASGFVSSSFSVGNEGYGNVYSRTAIMAVVGGTTSVITGGKFANGAETGAFVHLYNAEGNTWNKIMKYLTRVDEIRNKNKAEYYAAEGEIYEHAGELFSGIASTDYANKLYNEGRIFKEDIYTGQKGAMVKLVSGKSFPGTIMLRTLPSILGAGAFHLGQEAGFVFPAYVQAWKEMD